jgi:hypothetical protein
MELSVLIVGGIVAIVGGGLLIAWFVSQKQSPSALKRKLLIITLPDTKKTENENPLDKIALSEQLLSALTGINEPFTFEVAVHHVGTDISFYCAIPEAHVSFAMRQIEGLIPEAHVVAAPEYTIFASKSSVRAGYLTLRERGMLPVRSYEEAKVDTFAPLLSVFSRLREAGEGAALQFVVKPAPASEKKNILSALSRLKQGEKLSNIIKTDIVKEFTQAAGIGVKKKTENDKPKPIDEGAVAALEKKLSKPLLLVNVRVVTSAENEETAEDLFLGIASAFSQFTAPLRNEFKVVKVSSFKRFMYNYVFREFSDKESMLLNTEEVTSIFHLPISTTETPRIKWLSAKEGAPPQNLPKEGIVLGESIFRGATEAVRLIRDDRRKHLYMIGQTGTGKSTLIKHLVLQDIRAGEGVCVIDPNGDLIDDILGLIPNERVQDVIVFDPGSIERPLGLNMLEHDPAHPEQKTFIVNEMQSIFNRLFVQETMGPMFEQYMRNALLLLMDSADEAPATLVEVPRVFTDKEFRNQKLARAKNPVVIDFWTKEAEKAGGDASLANMTPYITSKFNNFIANDYVRPIIGQPQSAFNFREVMDGGKILLVKLSKGRIGDINANLLGMIITGKLLMAAFARQDTPQEDRRDFFFYIDEFQNFTTDSISTILSEARKYRLNLTIAHQFIAQLDEKIRNAVFGNVGSLVAFRVGADDAEYLLKQFEPDFAVKDLIGTENTHAIVRMLINGQPSKPFTMRLRAPERGSTERALSLAELSRLTFGRDIRSVEEDILARLRS